MWRRAYRRTKGQDMKDFSRREFLVASAASAAMVATPRVLRCAEPGKQLRLAFVGIGGRGGALLDMGGRKDIAVTVVCDCDKRQWGKAAKRYANAKLYQDYRKMFDEMAGDIDAVVVATHDPLHVPVSIRAVRLGKAVYCEKPLGWSVYEVRELAKATAEKKVATQCGNQGHANEGNRLTVEWIRAGAIGRVKEVHTWTDRPARYWAHGIKEIPPAKPCPPELDWECWLGPRTWPHFHDGLLGMQWRRWYELGTGAVGDQICHGWDNVFWSLDLDMPTSIEPIDVVGKTEVSPALQSTLKMAFPAKGERAGVACYYHTGGRRPPVPDAIKNDPDAKGRKDLPTTGTLYIGEKGYLVVAGDYGESPRLAPEALMKDFKRPEPTIARSPGHDTEWFQAAAGEKAWDFPKSNFTYSARLTECGLLAIAAERAGKTLEYDAAKMQVTNVPEANKFIRPDFRKGWEI
jgi:hypothetical protein